MDMQYVSSSNLKAVGYDKINKILRIEFKSGWTYDYRNISESLYTGLMNAPSHGEYHAKYIKHLPCNRIR